MYYEPPERRRPRRRGSILDSPILAVALVVVVLGLAGAIVFMPGILPLTAGGPNGTSRPGDATPTPAGPTPVTTFARPTPSPAPTFLTHRVKAGDSLNSIARKYRTTARSVAWWNRATYPTLDPESSRYNPDRIKVGWVLLVMPDVIVDDADAPTLPPEPILSPAPSA
jgi:hypothetical protein